MKIFLIALFPISIFSTPVVAQQCSECNASLRKDIFSFTSNLYIYSKYLEEITEKEYDELKHDASAIASIPIPEIQDIVQASLTYSDFQQKIHEYTLRIEKEDTYYQKIDYKVYRTDPGVYKYWAECMQNCVGKPGIFLINQSDAVDHGVVMVRYVGAVEEPDQMFCEFTISTEDSIIHKVIQVKKGGSGSITYRRKFRQGQSETTISVNARRKIGGPIAYTDNLKSVFVKPSAIKVLSLDYSYIRTLTRVEVGETVQNCLEPPPSHENGRVERGPMKQFSRQRRHKHYFSDLTSNGTCPNREMDKSCDGKFVGYYATLSVTPSPGYAFNTTAPCGDLVKLTGSMADWNGSHRCHDSYVVNSSDLKQVKVWMHKEVSAHLELMSYKDSVIRETVFSRVDETGTVKFTISDEKLNQYNIVVRLSNGSVIDINEKNVNQLAYQNKENGETTFTLKGTTR